MSSDLSHKAGYLMKMAVSDTITFGAETCSSYTPNFPTAGVDLNPLTEPYTAITSSFIFTSLRTSL
jgi:hypothetical protein